MTKFKAGDVVELTGKFVGSAQPGARATVLCNFNSATDEFVRIAFDRTDLRCGGQMDGGYLLSHVRKVPAPPKVGKSFTIQDLPEGGYLVTETS